MKLFHTILLFILSITTVYAQPAYNLNYKFTTQPNNVKLKTTFTNRPEAEIYLNQLPQLLFTKGYIAASIDSVNYKNTEGFVTIYLGQKYSWAQIKTLPKYQPILNEILSYKKQNQLAVNDTLADWRQSLLDYFEENGKPFASLQLDSVQLINDSIFATLNILEGSEYKIDSVHNAGRAKINKHFLEKYLHIQAGMKYKKSILDKIDQRLNELNFLQQSQPWSLSLLAGGATINTYLEPQKSNQLNILIGFLPASPNTPANKLLITGDANILLKNSLGRGETIGLTWQQIQYKSPRLNVQFIQPYLFNSNFGIDIGLDMLKKDTFFVNIQTRLGVQYEVSSTQTGKIIWQTNITNVSTIDTNYIKQNRQLPDLIDVSSSNLGLEYEINTTNYRQNPKRGLEAVLSVFGGLKKIRKSGTVINLKDPNINYSKLYDSIQLKAWQAKLKLKIAKYFTLGKQSVLKTALQTGWYQSPNYFRNEMFQVGGFKLLRGFDEESIYANLYNVFTAEYRLLFSRNSYFFGFVDVGKTTFKNQQLKLNNNYIGTGFGLALDTKNSLLNISWAVGKQNSNKFDFRQSKIHIGFVNYL